MEGELINMPDIQSGNSGSPVVNIQGKAVGIISAIVPSISKNYILVTPLSTKNGVIDTP
jgi:hypothetical protein